MLERAFIGSLSAQSRRFRFLGQIGCPSDEMIRGLTDIDYVHDVAFGRNHGHRRHGKGNRRSPLQRFDGRTVLRVCSGS